MNYAHCQIEDLLTDSDFIRWVKSPTPQLDLFWGDILRLYPDRDVTIKQARSILLAMRFEEELVTEDTIGEEWERFRSANLPARQESRHTPVVRLHALRSWWWAAAVVAGLLFGTFWWLNKAIPDTIYRTGYGQVRHVQLPDGSELTLNSNSEVRLPPSWGERPIREIWLKGEGFLHVMNRKGKSQPRFIVHTGELDVEVLGTAFNVKSRHNKADVGLQSGSIRLQLASRDTVKSLLMRPGDAIGYQPATGQLTRRLVRMDQMAAWRHGVLLLDDMTLREVGQFIEDTYGHQVVIRSPLLASRVLNGSVPTKNERALLEGIAVSLDVPVHFDKGTVVFGE